MNSAFNNLLISAFCLLTVFFSNFIVPSQSNGFPKGLNYSGHRIWENAYATADFNMRYHHSEFRRRPIVLEFQQLMKENFDIPYQFSFNFINYLCLFLCFLLLPKLSDAINRERYSGIYLQLFLLLSLPILCAYYRTIYTYDDTVQYFLLTLFLIFLFRNHQIPAMVAFLAACISRETSLIYLMIVASYFHIEGKRPSWKPAGWIASLLLYALFLTWYLSPELLHDSKVFLLEERFYAWKNNFGDFRSFRESTTVLLLMLGLPLLFLSKKIMNPGTNLRIRNWAKVAVFLLLANAAIVSLAGLIRESRLLFLPLLLTIPIIHTEIEAGYLLLKKRWKHFPIQYYVLILSLSALLAFGWYTPKTVTTGYLFKGYAFAYCSVLIGIILMKEK